MDFYLFALFFITTFILCLTFLNLGKFKRIEQGQDTSNKAGLAVCGAIVLGWTLLQVATPKGFFPFKEFIFGLYPFLIAAAGLSMYVIYPEKIRRFWVNFFICLLSVVFLPQNWLVFQGFLPLFFDRFATAVLWALFIGVYTRMDKANGLTIIQTSALCLGFTIFPSLAFRGEQSFVYTSTFAYYPMIILAAMIGFISYKKRMPDVLLGKTGAVPLGYLMGLFFVLMAAKGFWLAALIMPAYYYFEIIYSSIYKLIHRNAPEPTAFTFFISFVIRKNLNARGLLPLLFLIMLGFSLTGFLFNASVRLTFALAGLLFFYLLYRMLHWGQPKITYRSMFHDTKEAAVLLAENFKSSINSVSTYIKEKDKDKNKK